MRRRMLWRGAGLLWMGWAGCGPSVPAPQTAPMEALPPPLSLTQVLQARVEQPASATGRPVVVISDLHLGLGRGDSGAWDTYEDFRFGTEWASFLQLLDKASATATAEPGAGTDLVLNGDVLELWQSRTIACKNKRPDLGCTQAEALGRTQQVIAAHRAELQALGQFAQRGDNRVYIVPGNHDGALLFPAVGQALLSAIGAPRERVSITGTGYWISRDRAIYVDHGHQTGIDPNGFSGWPAPFRTVGDEQYIVRPWGEQFMQAFYDAYEDRYPIIDNIASEKDAVRFAIYREGPTGFVRAVGKFVGFTLLKTSWSQRWELGSSKSPSTETPGGTTVPDASSKQAIFGNYLAQTVGVLQSQGVSNRLPAAYVFSHTHNMDRGFDAVSGLGKSRVVNTGAWQRVVTADWLTAEVARRGMSERDALVGLTLEDLPACYGVVRIPAYAANEAPQPEATYFHFDQATGQGSWKATCP